MEETIVSETLTAVVIPPLVSDNDEKFIDSSEPILSPKADTIFFSFFLTYNKKKNEKISAKK